jgi:NTP pyrophosphatase (non-canonical NTP hydrolase)
VTVPDEAQAVVTGADAKQGERQMDDVIEMRNELKTFAALQEAVLRSHDDKKGRASWKNDTPQALLSRLVEEFGEVITHLCGQDHVADFLIASLRDHIEESGVSLDYNPTEFRKELADVGNFCMMLHDVAPGIDPRHSDAHEAKA